MTHPHPTWYSTVTRLIAQGLRWVQIRDKIASDVSIFKQAQSIVQFCQRQEFDCNVLINDRVEVARALGVGVHLGQGDMSPQQARSILGPHATIGWTIMMTLSWQNLAGSIDYVGVGPIFPTTTKLIPVRYWDLSDWHRLLKILRFQLWRLGVFNLQIFDLLDRPTHGKSQCHLP